MRPTVSTTVALPVVGCLYDVCQAGVSCVKPPKGPPADNVFIEELLFLSLSLSLSPSLSFSLSASLCPPGHQLASPRSLAPLTNAGLVLGPEKRRSPGAPWRSVQSLREARGAPVTGPLYIQEGPERGPCLTVIAVNARACG